MSYDLHGNGSWDEGPSSIDLEIRAAKALWATCPPPAGIDADGNLIWPGLRGRGQFTDHAGHDIVATRIALQSEGWQERVRDPHWVRGYNPTYRLPSPAGTEHQPDRDRALQISRAFEEADRAMEEARLDARLRELREIFADRGLAAPMEDRTQRDWRRDPIGCLSGRIAEYEAALLASEKAAKRAATDRRAQSPFAVLAALRD